MKLKTLILAAAAAALLSFGSLAQAAHIIAGSLSETIVESRSGGLNFADYAEDGVGFPNSWGNSSAKSTAPGTTAGIGSRFNSDFAVGGSATWFEVSPTLPSAGGVYDVYVTVTHASGDMDVTSNIMQSGGTGLPASTSAFSVNSVTQPGNNWNLVGTLTLDPGVDSPTIRFEETALGSGDRFYADAVMFAEVQVIPEPATFALIGFGLAGIFFAARRRSA